MSLRDKLGALALAALLVLFWAVARDRGVWSARRAAPAARFSAPPEPAVVAVVAAKKARRKTAAPKITTAVQPPASRIKLRGERLREKGEALGGDATQRRMAKDEKDAEKSGH